MHRHCIHAEKQLLEGTGSAAAGQPQGGIQDRIPGPQNMQEGQSKAESSGTPSGLTSGPTGSHQDSGGSQGQPLVPSC